MVVPLGPGKFYGSSLPRPRYYSDVKLNDTRVDPPVPVLDSLLAWANEAHWSMGGLSFKRLRLQGRIEGNVNKLRIEREKFAKKNQRNVQISTSTSDGSDSDPDETSRKLGKANSVSPPPAPIAEKRRRFMASFDDEDEGEGEKLVDFVKKRRLVKKLGDDFDRVASESEKIPKAKSLSGQRSEGSEVAETVNKKVDVVNKDNLKGKKTKGTGANESGSVSGTRSSPRLAKRGSS